MNKGKSRVSPTISTSTSVTASLSSLENGSIDSEKAVQEIIPQSMLHGADDHLTELCEALRTIAKALRRETEGKASAQAEAAQWKRKYELEMAHNFQLEQKVLSTEGLCSEQTLLSDENTEQCELCNGKDVCAQEILQEGELDFDSAPLNKTIGKALFKLSWDHNGEICDHHKHDIVSFEKGYIRTAERSRKQISLKWESPPNTVLILTKPNSISVRILCLEMIRWLREQKKLNMFVEPQVKAELLAESSYYSFVQTWLDDKDMLLLHSKVDLIITLGGDGTVLWAASMFKGPVPPIVPFSLGSLGFMTPFHSEHYRDYLTSILVGPISITLRHRLQCHIIRENDNASEGPMLVLNEVTIDRGISSFLTNLECYCNDSFVTCVQGDGLILSTTSGSTAYSLAAGGSMVHPQVPGILFTPICPHSLSFRPLVLPGHVSLRVVVPSDSRSHAWVSFDGKDRKQLGPGDTLVCNIAAWPVPTVCQLDSTTDFLQSINDGLHWNLRRTQSTDGPRSPL